MLPIKEPLNLKDACPWSFQGLNIWIQTKFHRAAGGCKSWAGYLSASFAHLSTHLCVLMQSLGPPLEGALPPQLELAQAREFPFTQA